MNVLVITHRLDRGGAQLWLHELIERLARDAGVSFSVVAAIDGPLRLELEAWGIDVRITGDHPVHDLAEYEQRVGELADWASPQRFDVALVNTLRCFPAIEVADRAGLPSVFAIHESFGLERWWAIAYPPDRLDAGVKARGQAALRLATVILFAADGTRRLYETDAGPARVTTLPYGMEFEAMDRFSEETSVGAARERLGLDPEATIVLCLGLIEPRKAQICLAQAFGAIADRHPDAILALVGESLQPRLERHNRALREHLRRAGLEERVAVVPMTDAPYEWHRAADLFVCPSDVESLPRVVLEAMAFEVPVLATRIFGLPEVIDDGRNGWLCEPRDIGALADALGLVLALPRERRSEIGREGALTVRARHDPAAYAERFCALLDGLARAGS